ncbi:hypothetical protein CRUP_023146, partial [Coryphaenoides rupestris]
MLAGNYAVHFLRSCICGGPGTCGRAPHQLAHAEAPGAVAQRLRGRRVGLRGRCSRARQAMYGLAPGRPRALRGRQAPGRPAASASSTSGAVRLPAVASGAPFPRLQGWRARPSNRASVALQQVGWQEVYPMDFYSNQSLGPWTPNHPDHQPARPARRQAQKPGLQPPATGKPCSQDQCA